ncbi:MAG TPA: tRNA lysidine(34) synthetase TilS [Jatrophihabitans sp.]|jgi:tRNA(Ile)-lysidine synthase
MGPHPAVAAARSAVRAALPSGASLLVACSGGADSLALAAAVAFEAPRAGIGYGLVTVDHGLQPGSAAQAAHVAAIAAELGFDPVEVIPVEVRTDATAGGAENAARTARYAALDATARAWGAAVLLGHTLDDQAESVLLGLGRGSGPRSIAGMSVVTTSRLRSDGSAGARPAVTYVRPFLGLRRAQTLAACEALGLEPWHDPQNDDAAFRRVRLRHEVLPLLEDVLAGGVAEALARTATQLQDLLNFLDQQSAVADIRPGSSLDLEGVDGLPRAVRTELLRRWLGGELTANHLDEVDRLIVDWRGQGPIDLPAGRSVVRSSGKLTVIPKSPQEHLSDE